MQKNQPKSHKKCLKLDYRFGIYLLNLIFFNNFQLFSRALSFFLFLINKKVVTNFNNCKSLITFISRFKFNHYLQLIFSETLHIFNFFQKSNLVKFQRFLKIKKISFWKRLKFLQIEKKINIVVDNYFQNEKTFDFKFYFEIMS